MSWNGQGNTGSAALLTAALLAGCAGTEPPDGGSASITEAQFGRTPDGREARLFTLTNRHGLRARISDYGGVLVSMETPDRRGLLADVALGLDDLPAYVERSPMFGAVVGRYANRIAKGRFELDGRAYRLDLNAGPNNMHGGLRGFDKAVWAAEPFNDAQGPGLRLRHVSPDRDQGFPGALTVTATYRLTQDDRLTLDYRATTTRPTVVNLTHHGYWNLSGDFTRPVLDHRLRIEADAFTPVDANLIPTGELRPVKGTPLDFTGAKPIGRDIAADDPQIRIANGYDHNFVLRGAGLRRAARIEEPTSGRVMELWTTEPGMQLYTANYLNDLRGKGVDYRPRTGFCLEPQHFPDSPNRPEFPSTVLRPGQVYSSRTEFRFSTSS